MGNPPPPFALAHRRGGGRACAVAPPQALYRGGGAAVPPHCRRERGTMAERLLILLGLLAAGKRPGLRLLILRALSPGVASLSGREGAVRRMAVARPEAVALPPSGAADGGGERPCGPVEVAVTGKLYLGFRGGLYLGLRRVCYSGFGAGRGGHPRIAFG